MLKSIKRAALLIGVLGGGAVLAYNFLLDDSTKKVVKTAAKNIKKDVENLQEYVAQITGTVIDERADEYHKEQILKQWEDLGL